MEDLFIVMVAFVAVCAVLGIGGFIADKVGNWIEDLHDKWYAEGYRQACYDTKYFKELKEK